MSTSVPFGLYGAAVELPVVAAVELPVVASLSRSLSSQGPPPQLASKAVRTARANFIPRPDRSKREQAGEEVLVSTVIVCAA